MAEKIRTIPRASCWKNEDKLFYQILGCFAKLSSLPLSSDFLPMTLAALLPSRSPLDVCVNTLGLPESWGPRSAGLWVYSLDAISHPCVPKEIREQDIRLHVSISTTRV